MFRLKNCDNENGALKMADQPGGNVLVEKMEQMQLLDQILSTIP